MKYGKVPGVNKPISRLVQGTVMIKSSEMEQSFTLLDEVYELGCTTFDTAHGYGQGDCERTVGRWVRERGLREKRLGPGTARIRCPSLPGPAWPVASSPAASTGIILILLRVI